MDKSSFADYLFCVVTFLSPPRKRGIIWRDKSPFLGLLLRHLFDALESNIRGCQITMNTAANIISTTGQIMLHSEHCEQNDKWEHLEFAHLCQSVPYNFCRSLHRCEGWISVVLATGWFTARPSNHGEQNPTPQDASWVYVALDHIAAEGDWDDRATHGIDGLLAAMIYYAAPVERRHLPILLRALTIPGRVSKNAALLAQDDNVVTWFRDEQLSPILRSTSVWSSIMRIGLRIDSTQFTRPCILIGGTLVGVASWKSHIQQELCSWITLFFGLKDGSNMLAASYNSVLEEICHTEYHFANEGERALGLTYQVLFTIWADLKFTSSEDMRKLGPWLRCTNRVVTRTYSFICDDRMDFWGNIWTSLPNSKQLSVAHCKTHFFELQQPPEPRRWEAAR
ncbi:hypothetical protein C8R47DRAFT_569643 [Mycena vitilis]|nr:hypothetical protein C8R47DRAFT_569643 [Mycena vitilis]